MQQFTDSNEISTLITLIPDRDKKAWAYSKGDLVEIFKIVKESQQAHQEVINVANDSLVNKEDGSNGIEDFGISRGTNNNDVAHAVLSNHSAKSLTALIEAEERILAGKYTSICKQCGRHISLERLRYVPETRLCKSCVR